MTDRNHQTISNTPTNGPLTVQATGTVLVAAVVSIMSLILLVSGTAIGHMPLLAWGVVTGVVATAMASLVVVKLLIERAVSSSVERTAVLVGETIAGALRDGDERPMNGPVERIYS